MHDARIVCMSLAHTSQLGMTMLFALACGADAWACSRSAEHVRSRNVGRSEALTTSGPAPTASDFGEKTPGVATVTAGDQGPSDRDRRITTDARRAVMQEAGLSASAKNVTIVTVDAVVTLRGEVKNSSEKTRIERLVAGVPDVKGIDNLLETGEPAGGPARN